MLRIFLIFAFLITIQWHKVIFLDFSIYHSRVFTFAFILLSDYVGGIKFIIMLELVLWWLRRWMCVRSKENKNQRDFPALFLNILWMASFVSDDEMENLIGFLELHVNHMLLPDVMKH